MSDREATRYSAEISGTLWRLSRRKYQVMQLPPRKAQGVGRFDDPMLVAAEGEDEYGVLYLAVNPRSAFMETLSGLRSHIQAHANVLRHSFMEVDDRDAFIAESKSTESVVSRDWQNDWQLTSAQVTTMSPVFDLGDPSAVQFVRDRLAISLLTMGLHDLDFSHVLSDNRELTRAISRWLWTTTNDAGDPLFSGIRYRSRFDPECICLALYQDRYTIDGDIDIQPITPETPGFAEAASTLRLEIA